MIALQAAGAVLALVAALAWPRAGEAALLVPLGSNDLRTVLRWAHSQSAPLIELDPASGRVVARIASNPGLFSALGAGIVPIAARTRGCQSEGTR